MITGENATTAFNIQLFLFLTPLHNVDITSGVIINMASGLVGYTNP